MSPSDIAQHPSILAVRSLDYDFSHYAEFFAVCAACGKTGATRAGSKADSPCGMPGTCGFVLDASEVVTTRNWSDGPAAVQGAVEEFADTRNIWNAPLSVPPPPTARDEWNVRRAAVAELAPSLAPSIRAFPVGWFGLVEMAAHALAARGLGASFVHGQSKEKFGTARIYVYPLSGSGRDDVSYNAAADIIQWAVVRTGTVCAQDGTPDGALRKVGGWWITLGDRAWAAVSAVDAKGRRQREALDLYPDWAVSEAAQPGVAGPSAGETGIRETAP